jgi:serine/threonine protein kinase
VSNRTVDPSRLAGRFTVGRALGAGTFGVVVEAHEEGRTAPVALKKLSLEDAGALYDFKQEFRGLADVVHPNLVALHELFSVGPDLYLSMELVDGVGFLEHVHGSDRVSVADAATIAINPTSTFDTTIASVADPAFEAPTFDPSPRISVMTAPLDLDRLRPAIRQLAEGIAAIHRAGKLHRDLKPSNVLVTAQGCLKILDFGLIASLPARSSAASRQEVERRIVGTPGYMSPEQAMSAALTPASDWYSLGVMLYEALTGRLPIGGNTSEILNNKVALDPPDPRLLVADLPDDLADLCVGLLRRRASDRPSEAVIFAALGAAAVDSGGRVSSWADVLPFVGRDHHLAILEDAFSAARRGKAVTLQVHGTAGMGKSALLRRFQDDVADRDGAVVLEGRCYERESVPYKGVDSLIDALTQHLRQLPPGEAGRLLPPDIRALARVFPVLLRVEAIRRAPKRADAPDPLELRRRAFGALRELLARMASVQPLIVWIDDLQWGDADSAALLLDLLDPAADDENPARRSGAPALLLIASYRTEDAATIELVRVLRERLARGEIGSDVRELVVGPLVHREARALARVLLAGEAEGGTAEQIAAESGGSPLFVHELARHVRTRKPAEAAIAPGQISLHQVLTARLARLLPDARRLLESIAVAGRPIPQSTVCFAAGVENGPQVLAVLRSEHLIRSRAALERIDQEGGASSARPWRAEHADVECFHDRIRETVVASLSAEDTAARHAGLADALEAEGGEDIDALFVHLLGAGATARALSFVEMAAERSEGALAFDRAAALYRKAIELRGDAPQPLRRKLADALANAGRGVEAARAYRDATHDAPADESRDLRRRAAEQLLRAGHIDDGLAALEDVLADVGLELPKTPARALASLVFRRAQLSLRGTGFTERDAASVPANDLARIDVCWSVGSGLGAVDVIRGADFQARHLLLALRAGEPYRIARALAWEAILAAVEGGSRGRARGATLAARSAEIAARIQHPHAIAWAASAAAGVAYYDQRFREAVALSDRAVALFRETCTDIIWEIGSIQAWWMVGSLVLLGDLDELARRLPPCLHEAQELGALYNEASLRTYGVPRVHLAQDRPAEARRESADALQSWSKRGWHTQHLADLFLRANAYLYESDGLAALTQLREDWSAVESSQLLRVESVRNEAHWLHGSALILAARQGQGDRDDLLHEAERFARTMTKEKHRLATTYATQLQAGIALARGRHDRALRFYDEAAQGFDALQMELHAAASRRRYGEILGGEQGRLITKDSFQSMLDQRVRNPDRMAAMLAPV